MANFYAKYPPNVGAPSTTTVVEGEGVAGTPAGGVLTVQGDPAGTPIPISGTVTSSSASVSNTGSAVPAKADYVGYNLGGTLTGVTGTASGINTVVAAALPAGSAIIGNVRIDQTTPGTTNGVQVNAALPVGTNSIGNIGTVATVTGVTTVSTVTAVTTVATVTTVGTVSSVAAIAPVTTTTAAFQAEGSIAFGSLSNTYATLFTPTAATKVLMMRNNTNAAVSVSMDGGSTTNFVLDAGDQMNIDLLANALNMGATAIQVKYTVGAPTSGSFRINGAH